MQIRAHAVPSIAELREAAVGQPVFLAERLRRALLKLDSDERFLFSTRLREGPLEDLLYTDEQLQEEIGGALKWKAEEEQQEGEQQAKRVRIAGAAAAGAGAASAVAAGAVAAGAVAAGAMTAGATASGTVGIAGVAADDVAAAGAGDS